MTTIIFWTPKESTRGMGVQDKSQILGIFISLHNVGCYHPLLQRLSPFDESFSNSDNFGSKWSFWQNQQCARNRIIHISREQCLGNWEMFATIYFTMPYLTVMECGAALRILDLLEAASPAKHLCSHIDFQLPMENNSATKGQVCRIWDVVRSFKVRETQSDYQEAKQSYLKQPSLGRDSNPAHWQLLTTKERTDTPSVLHFFADIYKEVNWLFNVLSEALSYPTLTSINISNWPGSIFSGLFALWSRRGGGGVGLLGRASFFSGAQLCVEERREASPQLHLWVQLLERGRRWGVGWDYSHSPKTSHLHEWQSQCPVLSMRFWGLSSFLYGGELLPTFSAWQCWQSTCDRNHERIPGQGGV